MKQYNNNDNDSNIRNILDIGRQVCNKTTVM